MLGFIVYFISFFWLGVLLDDFKGFSKEKGGLVFFILLKLGFVDLSHILNFLIDYTGKTNFFEISNVSFYGELYLL
jgi:hypothetical protein